MEAFIDLSFIVFLFNYIISFIYSLIVFDCYKYKVNFIVTSIIVGLILGLLNLLFIPYICLFGLIIYSLINLVIDIKKFKVTILTLIIFYINYGFLLLIGGCFIYGGILYISTPYVTLFILIIPIYISLIQIIGNMIYKRLKYHKFKYKCKLYTKNYTYKELGYYDSGNGLLYNDIPVIFVKGKPYTNEGFKINIKGINDTSYTYIAYEGILKISNKLIKVYIVFVNNSLNFYNCNILLNKYVL